MRNENRAILERLFRDGAIRVHRGRLFDTDADPRTCDFARVRGMLLGLAIGDALGAPTEGLAPAERAARFGEVRDYLPRAPDPGPAEPAEPAVPPPVPLQNGARGFPTDDTQLAFWTLDETLQLGAFDPEAVARRFAGERIHGVGDAVATFVQRMKVGMPWAACASHSPGNGALMRIAPVLVPWLRRGGRSLWTDAALCARVTHDDTASLSACLAFVDVLWELLDRQEPIAPGWWVERYVQVADALELPAEYQPRASRWASFRGRLTDFVAEVVPRALAEGWTLREATEAWGSGPYLLETIPTVLLCLERHAHEPEEALVRAVNDTVDNDTVAAIVGAVVGALHGAAALPERWRAGLSGRISYDDRDDGAVFRLIDEAQWRWG